MYETATLLDELVLIAGSGDCPRSLPAVHLYAGVFAGHLLGGVFAGLCAEIVARIGARCC